MNVNGGGGGREVDCEEEESNTKKWSRKLEKTTKIEIEGTEK